MFDYQIIIIIIPYKKLSYHIGDSSRYETRMSVRRSPVRHSSITDKGSILSFSLYLIILYYIYHRTNNSVSRIAVGEVR